MRREEKTLREEMSPLATHDRKRQVEFVHASTNSVFKGVESIFRDVLFLA